MAGGSQGVEEVHVLWISEGMSCDGDTVSVIAASQPAIEDVVPGLVPGLPRVHLHNKVLDYSLGGEPRGGHQHRGPRRGGRGPPPRRGRRRPAMRLRRRRPAERARPRRRSGS